MNNLLRSAVLFFLLLFAATYLLLPTLHNNHEQFTQVDDPEQQQALLIKLLTAANTPEVKYEFIKYLPHNINSFTEGLLIEGNNIYESDGLYRTSHINILNADDGKLLRSINIIPQYFAEGIAILNDSLYQLTYREHKAFIYDKTTLQWRKTISYPYEGWGLTTDGHALIASDGSSVLRFLDAQTLQPVSVLTVKDKNNEIIGAINELEYINGKIYANVWPTDIIVIISLPDGIIEGWINLHGIKPKQKFTSSDSATNGIAFDARNNHLVVTGKRWPYLAILKLNQQTP